MCIIALLSAVSKFNCVILYYFKKDFMTKRSFTAKYAIIAVILSLIGIASTLAPAHIQSQLVMGVPLFLLFWVGISLSICAVTLGMGVAFIKYIKDNNE